MSADDADPLIAYVVAPADSTADRAACGLAEAGVKVARIGTCDGIRHSKVASYPCSLDSRESIDSALTEASRRLGFAPLIIHSAITAEALQAVCIEAQEYAGWHATTNRLLKQTLFAFQAAFAHFTRNAACAFGSLVTMGPAFSLVGARSLVAACTLVEGQRSLVKCAARQWGRRGIRVNWLALAPECYDNLDLSKLPTSPENGPPPPVLGRPPSIDQEGVGVLRFLGSAASRGLTGQTLNLDGGLWMVP